MITGQDIARVVSKLTRPLQRRVALMVGRAVVELIDDSTKLQTAQILARDDVRDGVERFQNYGFTSVPRAGAECVLVNIGGNTDHPAIVALDHREFRPTELSEGELAIWTYDDGVRILCKQDGQVHIGTGPTAFVALADLVDARISAIVTYINAHTHVTTATIGSSATPGVIAPPTPSLATQASVAAAEVKAK